MTSIEKGIYKSALVLVVIFGLAAAATIYSPERQRMGDERRRIAEWRLYTRREHAQEKPTTDSLTRRVSTLEQCVMDLLDRVDKLERKGVRNGLETIPEKAQTGRSKRQRGFRAFTGKGVPSDQP